MDKIIDEEYRKNLRYLKDFDCIRQYAEEYHSAAYYNATKIPLKKQFNSIAKATMQGFYRTPISVNNRGFQLYKSKYGQDFWTSISQKIEKLKHDELLSMFEMPYPTNIPYGVSPNSTASPSLSHYLNVGFNKYI